MKVAVVGHVEWGKFVHVDKLPVAGEIVHTTNSWQEVAGGGSVAAMQLANLAGNCMFFTAVGDDDLGRRAIKQLQDCGVEVYATIVKNTPTKDIFVHIDSHKERTITVTGNLKPNGNDTSMPWQKLASADAVYFVSGNESALQASRQAKILVSTARVLPLLKATNVALEALVCSANDASEKYHAGYLSTKPLHVISTAGIKGGFTDTGDTYKAETVLHNELVDTYGCGDSFAAGLTFALGKGNDLQDSLQLAASCGAQASRRRGSFGNS